MSAVDLGILGILKRQSMNAYEMNKHIESIRLKNWMKIGAPTVYQNLKKLTEKGYLSADAVKTGNMPEKVIYTMTDSGHSYFNELMIRFSKTPNPIYFDFNAFLINLDQVDKDRGVAMLKDLRQYFESSYANLKKDQEAVQDPQIGGKAIMEQYDRLFNLMIEWANNLIKEYEKRPSHETKQC